MVVLVRVRRWEKRNRSSASWKVIKVRLQVAYKLGVLNHFTSGTYFDPRHFEHKNCLILIKIFKSIYDTNLCKFNYFDNNWTTFMLKTFQYLGSKYVSGGRNVSILPICILLISPIYQPLSLMLIVMLRGKRLLCHFIQLGLWCKMSLK